MRELLQLLSRALREVGEPIRAARVEDAISASDDELDVFLTSNELWGGSGSIADQAGIETGSRTNRRNVEHALIELGKEQIRVGKINRRTAMWVAAFEEWEKTGVWKGEPTSHRSSHSSEDQ